jgi:hypothetical protein
MTDTAPEEQMILTRKQRHDFLMNFFTHHDYISHTPEERTKRFELFLDQTVAALPQVDRRYLFAAPSNTPASRVQRVRVVANMTGVGPVTRLLDVLRPSGRVDSFVDMGNPMKGINLFPFLQRALEGRALRAVGPANVLEISRTVGETAVPRRWPREVIIPDNNHAPILLSTSQLVQI